MSGTNGNEDLDAFLTGIESKMRGPFSSLEVSKAVTTNALRGSLSPEEYLRSISRVLSRTDKVSQLRILVGLLGINPSESLDEEAYNILTQAQEAPLYEEWVRVVAGLVTGIMFVDDESSSSISCRGEEANLLLDKTCESILKQVRQLQEESESAEGDKLPLLSADMYPLFAPFKYSLLNPDLLTRVIPEHKENPHFQVNQEAAILSMDEELEQAKASEEQNQVVHRSNNPQSLKNAAQQSKAKEATPVFLPGQRGQTTKPGVKKPAASKKTSMFMPSKRPGIGGPGRQMPLKGGRQVGAGRTQALLSKGRQNRATQMNRSAGVAGSTNRVVGRAQKFANSKSKMKMIDVTEVAGLSKEHQERGNKSDRKMTREEKAQSKKRKIMEAAAARGLTSKQRKTNETENNAKAAASAQDNVAVEEPAPSVEPDTDSFLPNDATNAEPEPAAGLGNNNPTGAPDWQHILQTRSNKLSGEDRFRVQQFFVGRYNPTPSQTVYKMKLHEERTTDPNTGQPVKETFYLELDYNTFTSKQSKKIKRY